MSIYKKLVLSTPVLLLFFVFYIVFSYASVGKLKKFLEESKPYVKFYGLDVNYDEARLVGFPFSPKLSINNFSIVVPDQLSQSIFTIPNFVVSYSVFGNWVNFVLPDQKFSISSSGNKISMSCVGQDSITFGFRLTKNPIFFGSKDMVSSIFAYINGLQYQDYGIVCDNPSSKEKIQRIGEGANRIRVDVKTGKKDQDKTMIHFSILISKYSEILGDKVTLYPSLNFDGDLAVEAADDSLKMELDFKNLSLVGEGFSIEGKGHLSELSFGPSKFNGEVLLRMVNYKRGLQFLLDKYLPEMDRNEKQNEQIESLLFALANKINENDLEILIKQNDAGTTLIGNTEFDLFLKKLGVIYNLDSVAKDLDLDQHNSK